MDAIMEAAIIAALRAEVNTSATIALTDIVDVIIERHETATKVAIVDYDNDKFLLQRDYHRVGWALNAIARVAEEIGDALDGEVEAVVEAALDAAAGADAEAPAIRANEPRGTILSTAE